MDAYSSAGAGHSLWPQGRSRSVSLIYRRTADDYQTAAALAEVAQDVLERYDAALTERVDPQDDADLLARLEVYWRVVHLSRPANDDLADLVATVADDLEAYQAQGLVRGVHWVLQRPQDRYYAARCVRCQWYTNRWYNRQDHALRQVEWHYYVAHDWSAPDGAATRID